MSRSLVISILGDALDSPLATIAATYYDGSHNEAVRTASRVALLTSRSIITVIAPNGEATLVLCPIPIEQVRRAVLEKGAA